jgi:hypothetical protein
MPKPWMWLRIASVVDGLFAVGHGLGHVRTVEGGLNRFVSCSNNLWSLDHNRSTVPMFQSKRQKACWVRGRARREVVTVTAMMRRAG